MFGCDMFTAALLGAALAMPPQMEQVLRARSSQQVLGLMGIMLDRSSIKRAHRSLAKAFAILTGIARTLTLPYVLQLIGLRF